MRFRSGMLPQRRRCDADFGCDCFDFWCYSITFGPIRIPGDATVELGDGRCVRALGADFLAVLGTLHALCSAVQ